MKPIELDFYLKDNADLSEIDENMLVTIGEEVAEYHKNAAIILGKLVLIQEKLPKHSSVKEFAKSIGKGEMTLRSYMSIERRLLGLDIPDDINYTARRLIAQQPNPAETLRIIRKHGHGSAEIVRELYQKIETKEKKEITCPHCHKEILL